MTLTDAGESCLRRSQQMLALMENVEEETASRSDELRGQLRITCSMSLAYAQMAAAVVDFLKLHPQLSRGEERTQVSVASHFSANEATALLRAALAGGGIALHPPIWPTRTCKTAACSWCCRSGRCLTWPSTRSTLHASICRQRCGRCWIFWCSGLRIRLVKNYYFYSYLRTFQLR